MGIVGRIDQRTPTISSALHVVPPVREQENSQRKRTGALERIPAVNSGVSARIAEAGEWGITESRSFEWLLLPTEVSNLADHGGHFLLSFDFSCKRITNERKPRYCGATTTRLRE